MKSFVRLTFCLSLLAAVNGCKSLPWWAGRDDGGRPEGHVLVPRRFSSDAERGEPRTQVTHVEGMRGPRERPEFQRPMQMPTEHVARDDGKKRFSPKVRRQLNEYLKLTRQQAGREQRPDERVQRLPANAERPSGNFHPAAHQRDPRDPRTDFLPPGRRPNGYDDDRRRTHPSTDVADQGRRIPVRRSFSDDRRGRNLPRDVAVTPTGQKIEAGRAPAARQTAGKKNAQEREAPPATAADKALAGTAPAADIGKSDKSKTTDKQAADKTDKQVAQKTDKKADAAAKSKDRPSTELVDEAILAIERELTDGSLGDDDREKLQIKHRLLLASAGRFKESVRSIEHSNPAHQGFVSNLMYGLNVFLDKEKVPRESHRAAAVARYTREAADEIADLGKLQLRNVAFCESVSSFGRYTEFKPFKFKAKQKVLIYVEIENFKAEQIKNGEFETELQGSYAIISKDLTREQREYRLPLATQTSRVRRRDYYIAYQISLPSNIDPGDYQLQLMIEDKKSKKSDAVSLDFSIEK